MEKAAGTSSGGGEFNHNTALKEAVRLYEKDVWARGHSEVEGGVANAVAVHNWTTLKESPLLKKAMGRSTE